MYGRKSNNMYRYFRFKRKNSVWFNCHAIPDRIRRVQHNYYVCDCFKIKKCLEEAITTDVLTNYPFIDVDIEKEIKKSERVKEFIKNYFK